MDVYEPHEDSHLLERVVRERARGSVVDVGTGTGIQEFAALENPSVTQVLAVDINPAAIERVEHRIAHLPKEQQIHITALISDQFFGIPKGTLFDTIISNPPYLPDEEKDADPALYGGPGGYEWIVRFIDGAIAHLAPGGEILLLFSSLSNKERIDAHLKKHHLSVQEVAQLAMFFERLYVYSIRSVR
jgi:release factor glutamine methyltransferase